MTANPEYERSILAIFIRWPELLAVHADLKPADMSDQANRTIHGALLHMAKRGDPINAVTLASTLHRHDRLEALGGPVAIAEIADEAATQVPLDHYVRWVRMLAARRRAAEVLRVMLHEAETAPDNIEDGEEWLAQLSTRVASAADGICVGSGPRHIRDVAQDALQDVRSRVNMKTLPGVPHGIPGLERFLPSLTRTDLITVAARPGMGKTAFAGQVITAAAMAGKVTLMLSLEMSATQVVYRMITEESRMTLGRLRSGNIHGPEAERITEALERVSRQPIWVDDTPRLTPGQVRARVLQLKQRLAANGEELALVVVDYIGLMKGEKGLDRHLQISAMTKENKALAKEADLPVMQLAQLNRDCEKRTDKRPQLADIKESGAIEEDSDVVIFLFREAYYDKSLQGATIEDAEVIVAKQRNGETGTVKNGWEREAVKFVERVGGF